MNVILQQKNLHNLVNTINWSEPVEAIQKIFAETYHLAFNKVRVQKESGFAMIDLRFPQKKQYRITVNCVCRVFSYKRLPVQSFACLDSVRGFPLVSPLVSPPSPSPFSKKTFNLGLLWAVFSDVFPMVPAPFFALFSVFCLVSGAGRQTVQIESGAILERVRETQRETHREKLFQCSESRKSVERDRERVRVRVRVRDGEREGEPVREQPYKLRERKKSSRTNRELKKEQPYKSRERERSVGDAEIRDAESELEKANFAAENFLPPRIFCRSAVTADFTFIQLV